MNNIDRLLNIVYRQTPLTKVFPERLDTVSEVVRDCFSWYVNQKSDYQRFVENQYVDYYKEKYTGDEVANNIAYYILKANRNSQQTKINFLDLYHYIAEEMLRFESDILTVSFDQLLEWNGLIDKVDSHIFFAMKAAIISREIKSTDLYQVRHDNERLRRLLREDQGLSENHMHLKGSGYTTDMNWFDFCLKETIIEPKVEKILKEREGKHYYDTLSFHKAPYLKLYLFQQCEGITHEELKLSEKEVIQIIAASTLDELELYVVALQEKFQILIEQFKEKYQKDAPCERYSFIVERRFLKDQFTRYLQNDLKDFEIYLLNCYLLAMNQFKTLFFQSNRGMGFRKFKDSEEIKEELLTDTSSTRIFETVFDKYYSEETVSKVEFRVAPKATVEEYYKLIDTLDKMNEEFYLKYLEVNKSISKLSYGIIVHFIKNPDESLGGDGVSRKEKSTEEFEHQANVLQKFFEQNDETKRKYASKIIGLDTANYELNVRPEVFGPCFRKLRKEISQFHHLHFTYHVGEEFVTLAEGLRAMDETIEFLNYKRGDRFGHGMALGHDCDYYFNLKGDSLYCGLETYIDDVVWMYYLISNCDNESLKNTFEQTHQVSIANLLSYLEFEYSKEIQKFPISSQTIYDYFCSYVLRGDDPTLYVDSEVREIDVINFEHSYKQLIAKYGVRFNYKNKYHKAAFRNPVARDLYFKYHYAKDYKKLRDLWSCFKITKQYIDCVKLSQIILRNKVYEFEIGIETNPSSNRKISFVNHYTQLPFLNFNNLFLEGSSRENLSISINTDDSAVFQTDLSMEYAYVCAALFREGYEKEDVYRYVEHIKKMGHFQSFITQKDNE